MDEFVYQPLKIPLIEFTEFLSQQYEAIDSISEEVQFKNFEKHLREYVKSNVDGVYPMWLNILQSGANQFQIPGHTPPFNVDERKKELKNAIENVCHKILNSDIYSNPEVVSTEQRENATIAQIENFLLKRLYNLSKKHPGNHWELHYLLSSNGFNIDYEEAHQLAEDLYHNNLLLEPFHHWDWMVAISPNGKKHVEENLLPNAKRILLKDEPSELKKVYEILAKIRGELEDLKERGYLMNEIVFDELQDIEEALPNLTKRNWKQMLTGKVFDLVSGKALGSALASKMFKGIIDSSTDYGQSLLDNI